MHPGTVVVMYGYRLGLTLIELLAALTIAAVLLSYAIPNMSALVESRRADSALNLLRAGINMARHAAINRNASVIVCPRGDNGCGPRNTWHLGTLIFEDKDGDNRYGDNDLTLTDLDPIRSGNVYWRAFRSRSYLRFTGRGVTDWQNGHLLYCPANGQPQLARQLVLNYAGRTYASNDSDGDGVHEDVRGKPLNCA